MSKQVQVVEVQTKVTGAKSVDKLSKDIKGAGVAGKSAGIGIAGSFKAATASIASAVPALRAFTVALASSGVGLIVIALGSMATLFSSAATKGAAFGKSLSTLRAITGQTAEELEILSDQAKELGSTTAFTAVQVLSLQTELAKLGFTLREIEDSTPAILDLSAALEIDLASAAAFAGSSIKGFGLDTQDTQRLVDVFAKSTSASALDFDKLRESMKVFAPTAKAVGLSVERTTALLASLADRGLSGSLAGTGLAKVFIELSKKGIDLEDALDKVNNSSNGLNTAIELVGINGGKSLLTLAGAGGAALDELEAKFLAAQGAAKELAETRLDNLAGDITKLGSAWEGFLLEIEDGSGVLNKLSRGAVQFFSGAITKLQQGIEITAFFWNQFVEDLGQRSINSITFVIGAFDKLKASLKLFANESLLTLSEVPIIGRAIDKEVVSKNIKDAQEALIRAENNLDRTRKAIDKRRIKNATTFVRFLMHEENRAKVEEEKKIVEEETQGTASGETDEEKTAREKKEKAEKDFREKLTKSQEDYDANTALKKIQLERERHLARLEALKLEKDEENLLKDEINALYDEKKAEAQVIIDETKAEKDKADAEALKELELKKRAELQQTFDKALMLAGEESKLGKAILVAKKVLLAKEAIMDAKAFVQKAILAINSASVKGAEAGTEVAGSVAKATNVAPPPLNIPFILTALATGAGVIGAVKAAVDATKSAASSAGVGGGSAGGGIKTPNVPVSAPPAFNVVGASETNQLAGVISNQSQTPIQTFVVSNDVTTAQSLERNIVEGASIG